MACSSFLSTSISKEKTMQKAEYSPWSGNTYPSKEKMLMVTAEEKGGDLQVNNMSQNVGGFAADKRPSIVGNVINLVMKLWKFGGQTDTKCPGQPAEEYAAKKGEPCAMSIQSASATMPIFETRMDGTGRLTVPLDYDSTVDDIAMTPAGVYVEDMIRTERNSARPVALRKRRKQTGKATHDMATGCGESGVKGGGKNRKDKKRHLLRMDIVNDLSMDDCYGYDYREAEDSMESASFSQRCLSSSFSPSSIGSVSSFHDALQDALVMEACMRDSFRPTRVPRGENLSATPEACQQDAASRVGNTTASLVVSNHMLPKCDIESGQSDFVVYTAYDVFTTPSVSPARWLPPQGLCKAFAYAWGLHCSDEEEEDYVYEEEDEDDDDDDEDEDDEYDDDNGRCADEDDSDEDADCVVFREESDDNDDSNTSGFEERKVRFNMKPEVYVMRAWDFAYRQARKGDWEMAARDRERFRKRIDDLEPVLGPALQPATRDKIYAERFSSCDARTNAQDGNVKLST